MPIDWLVYVCVMVASTVVSALLTPKPKDLAASALGDFTVPTAEEGRPVPIVLGTCKCHGPNVTWYGDLGVRDLTKKGGLFKGPVTVGHFYDLGLQMMLCAGAIDSMEDVLVGDKSLKAAGVAFPKVYSADAQTLTIELRDLFGGDDSEGGLAGVFDFYFGSPVQTQNAYLAGQFGGTAPAWRGLCYAVIKKMYLGTSPYLKNWAFILKSCPCPTGLDPAKKEIAGDCNPAYGLAHLLTFPRELGGLGEPLATLDLATFQAAANTLYTESFGISLLLDRAQSADAWLAEILHHANGVLYTDPASGLTCLKLIRNDYDSDTVLEFTESDWQEAPELTISAMPETLNKVVVRYVDREQGFTVRTAQGQDVGNYWARGEGADTVLDFLALSKPGLAQLVASREMLLLASEMIKGSGVLNRKAWALRPGSPFKLTFPAHGIEGLVCRVTNIRYGTLGAGKIAIDFAQDVFTVTSSAHTAPPPSGWVDPVTAPQPCAAQALMEAPYGVVGETRNVLALGASADSQTIGADIWTNAGAGYLQTGNLPAMNPTGMLVSPYSCKTPALDSVGFMVSGGSGLASLPAMSTNADGCNRGENIAWFPATGELVSWTTATDNGDGTFTVAGVLRGILDTVPNDQAQGGRVWFLSDANLTTPGASGGGGGVAGEAGVDGRGYTWHSAWDIAHAYLTDDTCRRNGSSYVALQPSTGKDPETETAYWDLMAQKGADGTDGLGPARTSATYTTGTLATGATETQDVTLAKTARLYKLTTTRAARVRLYSTSAARTSDAPRLATVDPALDSGCELEVTTGSTLGFILKEASFANQDSPVSPAAYLSVTNLGSSGAVGVTLVYQDQEA